MKTVAWRVAGLAMTLSLAAAMPAAAQQTTAPAVLTLPVAGTFSEVCAVSDLLGNVAGLVNLLNSLLGLLTGLLGGLTGGLGGTV